MQRDEYGTLEVTIVEQGQTSAADVTESLLRGDEPLEIPVHPLSYKRIELVLDDIVLSIGWSPAKRGPRAETEPAPENVTNPVSHIRRSW